MHTCPQWSGHTPHVGGPILPACKPNVLIGGQPAARVGDPAYCNAPPDVIAQGSRTVLIGGQMAARLGDGTAHGGLIVAGHGSVLIGDGGSGNSGGRTSDITADPPDDAKNQADALGGQQSVADASVDTNANSAADLSAPDGGVAQGVQASPGAMANDPMAGVAATDVGSGPISTPDDVSTGPSLRPDLSQSYLNPDGSPAWPPNDGFAAPSVEQQLEPGSPNLGRFGSPGGSFFTQAGTPYENLSLPYDPSTMPYTEYQILKPFSVQGGTAASYFDQPGGGPQFLSDKSASQLVDEGFLQEVPAAGSPGAAAPAPIAEPVPIVAEPVPIVAEPMPLVDTPILPEIFIP